MEAGLDEEVARPLRLLLPKRLRQVGVDRPPRRRDRRLDEQAIAEELEVVADAKREKQLKAASDSVACGVEEDLSHRRRMRGRVDALPEKPLVGDADTVRSYLSGKG